MARWEEEGRHGDERRWGGGESGREEWRRRSGYGFDPTREEEDRGRMGGRRDEWRTERTYGGARDLGQRDERGERDWRGGEERGGEGRYWELSPESRRRDWRGGEWHRGEERGGYSTYGASSGGYDPGRGAYDRWGQGTQGGAYGGGFGDYGGTGGYGAREHERHERGGWGREWEPRRETGWERGGAFPRDDDRGLFERMGDKLREGVRRMGKGPKGYKRSDDRIHDDVCERIARSGIDADEVEVKVEAGEVTLTGTVDSRETKRRLEDLADDVFGVDEVHDHLRLRREETRAGLVGDDPRTQHH